MPVNKRKPLRPFLEKLLNWEYWPFSLVYFPVFFYYFWLSIKTRSFFFFTASNPKIEFGGMFGEKKMDIFKMLPKAFIPLTELVPTKDVATAIKIAKKIGYPIIAKPNIGERGSWVKVISTESELVAYSKNCPVDFLLQELVEYPLELGVFYVKKPGGKGRITSIVRKGFLSVIGDGKHTVLELLEQNPRALINYDFSSQILNELGNSIPSKGENITLEPIGNHCRGTTFYDDNHLIDESLSEAFNELSDQIPDFYFGRFDIRCKSYGDLKLLKNFKILELNGAGSEPGHIYQPGYSLIAAYRAIFWHLKVLADISQINKDRGIAYWPFKEGIKKWRSHTKYNRLLVTK